MNPKFEIFNYFSHYYFYKMILWPNIWTLEQTDSYKQFDCRSMFDQYRIIAEETVYSVDFNIQGRLLYHFILSNDNSSTNPVNDQASV